MKRKRFAEEPIIAVLHEHEAGAKAGDLARKHGISQATLYNWKVKAPMAASPSMTIARIRSGSAGALGSPPSLRV